MTKVKNLMSKSAAKKGEDTDKKGGGKKGDKVAGSFFQAFRKKGKL